MESLEAEDKCKKYFLESSLVKCETVNDNNVLKVHKTYHVDKNIKHEFLIVCVHGCGSSAMSWASTSMFLSKFALVAAIDLRCHGNSFKTMKDSMYITVDVLVRDLRTTIDQLLQELVAVGRKPALLLLGHSIGAALCIRVSEYYDNLLSLIIIDYSEVSISRDNYSTAIRVVEKIPHEFQTIEDAISWSVETSYVSSLDSARISIPSQLTYKNDMYVWKCHPKNTTKHWRGWVSGTDEIFLNLKTMKVLIMRESLSTLLLSAHMQGNFQLKVIHGTTHSIHEDEPLKIAEIVENVINRHISTQKILAKITI
ncbi:hypothetical protein BEWA_019680 [Theileria equi strain WA]|uniref:Protein phosphatase methylesterase 1 n=1 Tax=Theileria equi strain WA TaxID=1537102 RepID=L0AU01_THEEQ|nr:hypothetical protein BEWA_019680 [Theileria equi strain WA]AFZ79122.1 hypothetical protein BEWA_019680 [Theileria equi strain WA]|eukprot:XP_004828788.1 hypothetical protein BEWA_019680 [Theileria equi strain WA]